MLGPAGAGTVAIAWIDGSESKGLTGRPWFRYPGALSAARRHPVMRLVELDRGFHFLRRRRAYFAGQLAYGAGRSGHNTNEGQLCINQGVEKIFHRKLT